MKRVSINKILMGLFSLICSGLGIFKIINGDLLEATYCFVVSTFIMVSYLFCEK